MATRPRLLLRLRSGSVDDTETRPTSARFWGRLLPEGVADIWEDLKLAERARRDVLHQIAADSDTWRLSSVVNEMPEDEADELMELRRRFGAVTAAISQELREMDERARAA